MERDNYNPYKFESSGESSDDKKDEKKKAKSASGLAKLIARQEEPSEKPKETEQKDERPLLEKLSGGPKKVEESAGSDQEVPLENLSEDEQAETAEAYVHERAKELADEASDAPELTAETKANEDFLEALRNRLSEAGDDETIDDVIDGAFRDASGELGLGGPIDEAPEGLTDNLVESEVTPDGPQDLDPDQAIPLTPPTGSGRAPVPPVTPSLPGGGPRPFGAGSTAVRNQESKGFSSADVAIYERRAAGRGLLVGGVVGYLIGRRRGRIKTEKRLKVVQEKLEKQVEQVQQKIEQKELVIRKLAHQKSQKQPERSHQSASRFSKEQPVRAGLEQKPTSTSVEKAIKTAEISSAAAVDSLKKEDLLAFSSQIRVGETSLRRVFEANMVDEKGLRRLIKEYQAGHDLRRALAREVMVKELRFERDPTLRDLLPTELLPHKQGEPNTINNKTISGGGSAGTVDTTQKTTAVNDRPTAVPSETAASTASQRYIKRRQSNVSPAFLVGLTFLTIGLAIYAIWLTLTR